MSQILTIPSILSFPMQQQKPLEQHSDEELTQLHTSNPRVFPILLKRYYQRIYRYCYSFFRDENLSAEATQEIFLLVSKGLSSFEHRAKFSTWLYRIAKNHCLNTKSYYERRQRQLHEPLEGRNSEMTREIPDTQTTSEESLLQKEENQKLYTAIERLSEEHQRVIVLRDIQEFAYEDIANMIGENIGTIKSRLFRARKHLREILSQ
jgi:RNA polymerase sigma-70 factor, ECF subfamily